MKCKDCKHEDLITNMLMLLSEDGKKEMYCVPCCVKECRVRGYSLRKIPHNKLAVTVDAINVRIMDKLNNGKK